MADDVLALALSLRGRGEPFAVATVVRCERPTSAKPGAKALIRRDGTVTGWVGGACAEPVVVREALSSLRDGQPRLIGLRGDGSALLGRTEGIVPYAMTCHSGGTLEIYVEPFLPKPLLVLVGHGPVVETLAALGQTTGFAVSVLAPETLGDELGHLRLEREASVVVATHGSADEEALERVLQSEAGYVSLIASRKRAAVVIETLKRRGVAPERLDRLKAPAGLDLGAITPEEIAVSILAEIVHSRRAAKPEALEDREGRTASVPLESKDPVCGMLVEIASARHRSEALGRVVYFCCAGCKEAFERDPQRYASALPG
jgi:xanthine dehydrogenase accessory factor